MFKLIPAYHFDYIKNSAFFTPQVPAYSFLPSQTTTLAVSCLRVLAVLTHCSTHILNNTQLNVILSIYTIGYLFALYIYFYSLKYIEALREVGSCLPWSVLPSCFHCWEYHPLIVGTVSVSVECVNEYVSKYIKFIDEIQPYYLV